MFADFMDKTKTQKTPSEKAFSVLLLIFRKNK